MKYTNLDYLAHRTKANPVLMAEIIGAYLKQTPPLVGTMNQSLQDKDWLLLRSVVHKMIPSFLIMGISTDYEHTARKIMDYAETHSHLESMSGFVLQLENMCLKACQELKEELILLQASSQ